MKSKTTTLFLLLLFSFKVAAQSGSTAKWTVFTQFAVQERVELPEITANYRL